MVDEDFQKKMAYQFKDDDDVQENLMADRRFRDAMLGELIGEEEFQTKMVEELKDDIDF